MGLDYPTAYWFYVISFSILVRMRISNETLGIIA